MTVLNDFLKRYTILIQFVLVGIAFFFLSYQISRPLVDYDEATYANVVVDTLNSGNVMSLQLQGQHWTDKPPLYFWMAMISVKMLGPEEYAFRIPIVLLSALCLWLVYAIAKELTNNEVTAALAFIVLLFSNLFLIFFREVRTDQGMVAGILGALYFSIKSWKSSTYAFWIFPSIAIGFLFKSVVAFFAFPIIGMYAFFYKQWDWLKSKWLWYGLAFSVLLVAPWHIVETIKYGSAFWDNYLIGQVFGKLVSTPGPSDNFYNYFDLLPHYKPWGLVIVLEAIAIIIALLFPKLRNKINIRSLAAPALSAAIILGAFFLAKTHLPTYVLPVFPFLALYIAIAFEHVVNLMPSNMAKYFVVAVSIVLVSIYIPPAITNAFDQVPSVVFDEKAIGMIYKQNNPATLHALNWPFLESINYYGGTKTTLLNSTVDVGRVLKAPFYLIVSRSNEKAFLTNPSTIMYTSGLLNLYRGDSLVLLYGWQDIHVPAATYETVANYY